MEQIAEQFYSVLFQDDRFNLLQELSLKFPYYGQEYSRSLLAYFKTVIKNKNYFPTVKLQALKTINCLMDSKNPYIVEYCGKKFYNRFKVFAEYRKDCKDIRRGTFLFQSDQRLQQNASEEFLILLLSCIRSWSGAYPLDHKNRPSDYKKLFIYLTSKGVSFPNTQLESKIRLSQNLQEIKKSISLMIEGISKNKEIEKVIRIGKGLKKDYEMIKNQIEIYMEMEDHNLIKELNHTLDLLLDGRNSYKAWKNNTKRLSIVDSPNFVLPPTCQLLSDLLPKDFPTPDDLSDSCLYSDIQGFSSEALPTEREFEYEKDCSHEWTGLGAEYCKLKDQLSLAEQSLLKFQQENLRVSNLQIEEQKLREAAENELKISHEKLDLAQSDLLVFKEAFKELKISLQAAELKNKKLEDELKHKEEVIEKLEQANTHLGVSCKRLEEDLEKYEENENFLRKEIKELFKKINTKKVTSDYDESSPVQPLRFSLILPTFDAVGQSEEKAQELEFSEDENITAEGFVSARKINGKSLQVANFGFFKELLKKKHGVLYEDLLVKVTISITVSSLSGQAKIILENKTEQDLIEIKTKLFVDSEDISVKINSESCEKIDKNCFAAKDIKFEIYGVPQTFPIMKLSFTYQGSKTKLFLLLPVGYTLFCQKSSVDIIKEWEETEEILESSASTHFSSLKKMSHSLLFHKNFEYAYIEQGGFVIASKSPEGVVLAICELDQETVSIKVKSKSSPLRQLVTSMILMQVSAN